MICPVIRDGNNVEMLRNSGIPFVIFGGTSKFDDVNVVCIDDVKGGYLATRYLLERGHKESLFLNGPKSANGCQERLSGYIQALREFGISYDKNRILYCNLKNDKLEWEQIKYQMTQMLKYTAVVAYSDLVAMKVVSLFKEDQYGRYGIDTRNIVGFDNVLKTLPLPIEIPSIGERDIKMSIAAPSLLLEMIASKEVLSAKLHWM